MNTRIQREKHKVGLLISFTPVFFFFFFFFFFLIKIQIILCFFF
eukprot:SAG11_NODE_3662_length_2301_cov_3.291099_1_plen_43_part_10